MFVLKTDLGNYYVIKTDSYGHTVDWVTQDEAGATKFDSRREALEVKDGLDDYWSEQCRITTTSDCPF